jgi:hypothetical protein
VVHWDDPDEEPERHLTRPVLAVCVIAGLAFWALLFWIGYAVWPVLP